MSDFFNLTYLIASINISINIKITKRLALTGLILIRSVSLILTVKSRHDTFFRSVKDRDASPTPFDTGISDI
jgi:hypothetical protein